MKRILFVGHRDLFFGAESVLYRVINLLTEQEDCETYVILPTSDYSGFRAELVNTKTKDIVLLPFKLISGSLIKSLLCLMWSFYSIIYMIFYCRAKNIDVICSNTSVNIVGAIASLLSGRQHIWYFHEQPTGGVFKWIPKALYPLYRYLLSRNKLHVIFISKTQKSLWEKEFKMTINNSSVIYTSPSEVNKIVNLRDDNIVFGFLGSWTPSKNILQLINCFNVIRLTYPQYNPHLVIMGEGELRQQIIEDIEKNNLTKEVTLLNHAKDVSHFFSMIDIFVLPSKFESWGLAALEAISLGKHVILTKNTALTELLVHNNDCVFVNTDEELYTAMETAIINKEFRLQVAQNGANKLNSLNLSYNFRTAIRDLFLQKNNAKSTI